jgi:hypothetical protein
MGGLIGQIENTTVTDCYATGWVQGMSSLGGLIGEDRKWSQVSRCWAAGQMIDQQGAAYVGGLMGYSNTGVTSCYHLDPDGSGRPGYMIGTPLTEEQMRQKASFPGWDFETVWTICEGKDYPRLQWEQVECE